MGPVKKRPTKRRRSLPLEAAAQYGLLEKGTYRATQLAERLATLSPPRIYDEFARHILLNCGGLRVVEAVEEMRADGRKITGDSLAAYLTDQGFPVTVHNTAINSLRMWLAKSGIFSDTAGEQWTVKPDVKERVLGLTENTVSILVGLSQEQVAFVDALCQINPSGWYPASDVRALAEANSGLRLSRSSLPKHFLEPLKAAGLITYRSGGTRSGKTARVRLTAKFKKDVLEAFVRRTIKDLDPAITAYYKKRPESIYADLESKTPFVRGRALEAYAIHIMRLLGLRFLEWRKRADATAWAEVDALFAGLSGSVPTRWQVQCKNTPKRAVELEDIAREVGLLPVTQATHILLVANARITADARRFATEVMQRSPVVIFLLDRNDFEAIKRSPGAFGGILRDKAAAFVRDRSARSVFEWKGR